MALMLTCDSCPTFATLDMEACSAGLALPDGWRMLRVRVTGLGPPLQRLHALCPLCASELNDSDTAGPPMSADGWRAFHQRTCATCEDGVPVNGQGERFCPDCGRQP